MLFQTTLLTAALAALTAAAPAISKRDLQIIGYRVCAREEGERLNAEGLFYEGTEEGQIGVGMSTSYNPGGYPADNPDDMFCVIRADSSRMEAVSKCWIPQYWEKVELWFDDGAISDYIEHFDVDWKVAKTIRFGVLEADNTLELLIPTALVSDASMGFTVECFDNVEQLPTENVNYDAWSENIKGDRYPKPEDLPDSDDDDDEDDD